MTNDSFKSSLRRKLEQALEDSHREREAAWERTVAEFFAFPAVRPVSPEQRLVARAILELELGTTPTPPDGTPLTS